MKITQKRISSVTDGMLVRFNSSNLLEPYDGTGTAQGIASNCREVAIQPDPDQPPANELVCELVIDGAADILIDGAVSSQGATFGASTTAGYLSVGATPTIGHVLPQAWSDTSDRVAGLVPALICMMRQS